MAAGVTTEGRRVPDSTFGAPGGGWETWRDSRPGDYMKVLREVTGRDVWYIRDPHGVVGALRKHTVAEHEDGTITVTPSILDDRTHAEIEAAGVASIAGPGWHGYLERGVWREV